MKILGISAYYHDSAATIIENGLIIAATQEERFSRIKNDESFPINSIQFCLAESNLTLNELDAIVFYEKPFLKFERILDTYFSNAPSSLLSFLKAIPIWLKEKLFLKNLIRKSLKEIDPTFDKNKVKIFFSEHHLSHAASAFYPSNFNDALIIVMDGVGEYATTSIFKGNDNEISPLFEQHFPNSSGLLYSSITQFLGFKVNKGEYKVMGLAPYSYDQNELTIRNIELIKSKLVTIFEDGSLKMNTYYFQYEKSLKMIHTKRFENLFGIPQRKSTDELTIEHASIAQALQIVLEEIMFKTIQFGLNKYSSKNLCLAGGVALNCVLNGKIYESNLFEHIYIQPAAGDAGGSLGAALALHHIHFNKENKKNNSNNYFLGPSYEDSQIVKILNHKKIKFQQLSDEQLLSQLTVALLKGKIIGNFRGRMEFGPRALGNRSILANPLKESVQLQLNLKIKKRESFRPFAPIMLMEEFEKYFEQKYESPFMLMVHSLKTEYRINNHEEVNLLKKVQQKRSPFPGITHVDYSSRIQTVSAENNSFLHKLLLNFKKESGIGILINTSFNVKDEPIVCTPEDALNCFNSTEIDILVLNNFWIEKWNS